MSYSGSSARTWPARSRTASGTRRLAGVRVRASRVARLHPVLELPEILLDQSGRIRAQEPCHRGAEHPARWVVLE
jgi:hypothetical protein